MKKKLTIDKQENLLNKSIEQHLDFSELLNDQELSYDDLSYTQDDYIPKECLEKMKNFYISKREELAKILAENGISENFEGVFHGGPPCQSFSIAANQRFNKEGENFKRKGFDDEEKGMLIFDYIWFIKKFKPKAFLIENVEGILECDSTGKIKKALDDLKKLGYKIAGPRIFDASYYGVPQKRKRFIVIGSRTEDAVVLPEPAKKQTPCGPVFMRDLKSTTSHITYPPCSYHQRDLRQ